MSHLSGSPSDRGTMSRMTPAVVAGVLTLILAIGLLAVNLRSAGAAPQWPLDITYEVTIVEGGTRYVSTERLTGASWSDWKNEVLELEPIGVVDESIAVPPGAGSCETRSPDGTVRTVTYPGFLDLGLREDLTADPTVDLSHSSVERIDPDELYVPHPLMSPNLAAVQEVSEESFSERAVSLEDVLDDNAREHVTALDLPLSDTAAMEVNETWECTEGDCEGDGGLHSLVTTSVYAESAQVPVLVSQIQDGEMIQQLRVTELEQPEG